MTTSGIPITRNSPPAASEPIAVQRHGKPLRSAGRAAALVAAAGAAAGVAAGGWVGLAASGPVLVASGPPVLAVSGGGVGLAVGLGAVEASLVTARANASSASLVVQMSQV